MQNKVIISSLITANLAKIITTIIIGELLKTETHHP